MRVAVVGASGFVGRHVLNALAACGGADVVAADRVPSAALPDAARYVPLDMDEAGPDSFDRLGRPDVVIHLAWGGLPNYLARRHFEEELPRQYAFLRSLVEAGLPSLLVTGTCYEYGMADGALTEDRAPAPANPYAFAKTMLLRQLGFLRLDVPFALTWARLFYLWGESQAPSSIYPQLLAAAARGDAIFPMSGGEQLRDYLPAAEVGTILSDLALECADAGVVNISSGRPVSMRAMVEGWIEQLGSPIVPALGRYPYPSYEPMAFWGSVAKRQALLGSRDEKTG